MLRVRANAVAVIVVSLFGFCLFFIGTDGFQAFTAETARLNQLKEKKPIFPDVTLEDSKGATYSFSEFNDKYVLITFIYTSCATVCIDMEMNMAEVYRQIPDTYLGKDIHFLSISFDPERDIPTVLDKYKDYFGSDGDKWRMARIPDQAQLDQLLSTFGVIVIPDDYGNFAHNAAFYLVDRSGRLVDVLDYTKTDDAAKEILRILEEGQR
nr:SCO family protein [Paenibacillus bovis]